jgi:hypothetical protein
MVDEIHVDVEINLLLRETTLRCEKALKDGLLACPSNRGEQASSILGPEGTYLGAAPIAQRFDGRVVCCVHHDFQTLRLPAEQSD